jgi:hypothetical protein
VGAHLREGRGTCEWNRSNIHEPKKWRDDSKGGEVGGTKKKRKRGERREEREEVVAHRT